MALRNKFIKIVFLVLFVTVPLRAKLVNRKGIPKKSTVSKPQEAYNYSVPNYVISDIPVRADLTNYLKALNKIINFCTSNRNEVDLNFAFGLFLVNVNLKAAMKQKYKTLPQQLKKSITGLTKKNTGVLSYFATMVMKDKDPANNVNKLIYTLFSNETQWIDRMHKYGSVLHSVLSKQTPESVEKYYQQWEEYFNTTYVAVGITPTTKQSDSCLASLAENRVRPFDSIPTCALAETCYKILINGTDYGYALTHRMLLMLMARYGRGCAIFSPNIDRELLQRYCSVAYIEAEYIAYHNYEEVDLLMEQISLCTLNGHVEFIKRSWMKNILAHQTSVGCFGQPGDTRSYRESQEKTQWTLAKHYDKQSIEGGTCNSHVTATAAATISAAIRYILLTNFNFLEPKLDRIYIFHINTQYNDRNSIFV